ncbi:hypothetical protein PBCVNEJV1_016R [Paramecium bursaria Chlorella virus NE-JV-1]|nr:hypothetical protein PBCVNEJV1_016R [Paramecium bursaria Chlorella virus NE-JV-1]
MSKFEDSVARLAASLAEIKAAQKHTIVIDRTTKKSAAGPSTITVTKHAPRPVVASTQKKTATTARDGYVPVVVAEKKAKKNSKLNKLLKGKTFDLSK